MKNSKSARIIVLAIALLFCFSSCTSVMHKVNTGPDRPMTEVAVFNWEGTWYMGLGLYKVDGRPYSDGFQGGTWECMYNSKNVGGFNLAVLPGERVFEFFNVASEPVKVFQLRFNLEAGKTYTLKGNEKKFVVICGGTEVKTKIEPIPLYREPVKTQPHGTLKLRTIPFNGRVALFRIDGKADKPMYKLPPKWATINDFNTKSEIPYEVRLQPGKHTIEYVVFGGANDFYGYHGMGSSVKTLTFNVNAGKIYTYREIPDPDKGKSGRHEDTIELIEN